jgi:NADH:ubiquinone oxidoreductase subunit C
MTDEAGSSAAVPSRLEALGSTIAQAIAGLTAVASHTGELTYEVPADRLLEVAATLRDRADLNFEMCMDVCGVDYLEHGRDEWKTESATLSGFSRARPRAAAGRGGGASFRGGLPSAVDFVEPACTAAGVLRR